MSSTVPRPAARSATGRSRLERVRRVIAWIVGASCLAGATLWAGLRVEPAPLPPPALTVSGPPTEATALPDDLPAPVERFYRTLYGAQVPVIDTIVVSGRGTMRIQGITFRAASGSATAPARTTGTTSRRRSSAPHCSR
jgi:hypothetical protein